MSDNGLLVELFAAAGTGTAGTGTAAASAGTALLLGAGTAAASAGTARINGASGGDLNRGAGTALLHGAGTAAASATPRRASAGAEGRCFGCGGSGRWRSRRSVAFVTEAPMVKRILLLQSQVSQEGVAEEIRRGEETQEPDAEDGPRPQQKANSHTP